VRSEVNSHLSTKQNKTKAEKRRKRMTWLRHELSSFTLTSICSLLFLGEISLCGNQKYPQRIVQRDFSFWRKKKKQKSPYVEEKTSKKLSYIDIKFVEVVKTKQNSTFFSYFFV